MSAARKEKVISMLLSEFVPGEVITVKELKNYAGHRKKWFSKVGEVKQAQDRFIVVDYGNYRGTISFGEIKTGQIKIMRGVGEMPAKKMTEERLTELCKQYGFGKKAYEKMSEILGVQWHSIEVAVSKLGIRKAIEGENEVETEQEEPIVEVKENSPINEDQLGELKTEIKAESEINTDTKKGLRQVQVFDKEYFKIGDPVLLVPNKSKSFAAIISNVTDISISFCAAEYLQGLSTINIEDYLTNTDIIRLVPET